MNSFFEVCLAIGLLSVVTALNVSESSLLYELGPTMLSRFSGIGNQEVLHWMVHNSPSRLVLRFSGTVNQTGDGIAVSCPVGNVLVVVRRGAIPLPNPRASLVPYNTLIRNDGDIYSGSFSVSNDLPTINHDVEIISNRSESEHYFAAVFLPYELERFGVDGLTKDCAYFASLKVYAFNATNVSSIVMMGDNVHVGTKLARKQSEIFSVYYVPHTTSFNLSIGDKMSLSWNVYALTDSGGTLQITIKSSVLSGVAVVSTNASVLGCLKRETSSNDINCTGDLLELSHSLTGREMLWNVPFPIAGLWSLDVWFDCRSDSVNCSNIVQSVEISVGINSCIEDCHSDLKQGYCRLHRTVDVMFAACTCSAGWIGISCNDGRFALSYAEQVLRTLLLTLSNLMFLGCVVLAIQRRFYTEALVYFFLAFMSAFYHACDQPGIVEYCLLPFDTLQFCDFFGSVSAVWFTLIALAELPSPAESWLHVLGCLVFAVVVAYRRFSVWVTVAPAIVGAVIVVAKWVAKCRQRRRCYPGRKRTLLIAPGLLCAVVGVSLYTFVETADNYHYVHSIWHVLMASAVVLLLPTRPEDEPRCCEDDDFRLMTFLFGPGSSVQPSTQL